MSITLPTTLVLGHCYHEFPWAVLPFGYLSSFACVHAEAVNQFISLHFLSLWQVDYLAIWFPGHTGFPCRRFKPMSQIREYARFSGDYTPFFKV